MTTTYAELHSTLLALPWSTAAERRRQRANSARVDAAIAAQRAESVARHGRYVCLFCECGAVGEVACRECEGPVAS